jgi:hypothetical protein
VDELSAGRHMKKSLEKGFFILKRRKGRPCHKTTHPGGKFNEGKG